MEDLDKGVVMGKERNDDNNYIQKLNGGWDEWMKRR